ncbi:MAG: hypothetical protein JRJ59_06895 [Deltaproteobacteria bacterium]|nr:hypothetical protein [Deltaproteobacteria bacterium]
MQAKVILVLLLLLGLAGAGYYAYTSVERQSEEYAGGVYDYLKDQELVRTVNTALSLEAVMTRLTLGDKRTGKPEVRYGIDTVSKVGPNEVKVSYRLYIQSTSGTQQTHHSKRFRRKADGTWAAVKPKG